MQVSGESENDAPPRTVSGDTVASILLAEYRALYDLALFRLGSLDRRVPLTGSVLAGFLGGAVVLPRDAQLFLLVTIPLAVIWFVRTTINHARSFEDALRRIEEIENRLNSLAGEPLVEFQTRHPSRLTSVGGRTGTETVATSLLVSLLLLSGCTLAIWKLDIPSPAIRYGLSAYVIAIALYLLWIAVQVSRYTYDKSAPPNPSTR